MNVKGGEARYFPKHRILSRASNVAFSSPVSGVYPWNAWDHDALLARKSVAFSDSGFPYTEARVIKYRSSAKHSNWAALSRLPYEDSKIGSESEIYSVSAIDKHFPIITMDIGKATSQDPVPSKVHDWVMRGWPEAST